MAPIGTLLLSIAEAPACLDHMIPKICNTGIPAKGLHDPFTIPEWPFELFTGLATVVGMPENPWLRRVSLRISPGKHAE
jgi:hypothetical protein